MSWVSFLTGGMTFMFAYFLFTAERNEDDEPENEDLEVNDFNNRYVTLSCQSCRKLKKHIEIEPNLFQCVKCKRLVDVRRAS